MDNYLETINELNALLYGKAGDYTTHSFNYRTNGYSDIICFNEDILFSSEDEERIFDEQTGEYEPLTPYVKRMFNERVEELEKLKF